MNLRAELHKAIQGEPHYEEAPYGADYKANGREFTLICSNGQGYITVEAQNDGDNRSARFPTVEAAMDQAEAWAQGQEGML